MKGSQHHRARYLRHQYALFSGLFFALLFPFSLRASPGDQVSLLLKWRHQFQSAGYYAAKAKGFYAAEGLDVTILEGGPDRSPISTVLAGGAAYGVSDAEIVLARLKGSPVVACASIFQHSPYVLMSRRDRNIRSPADLVGARVMLSDEQGAAQMRTMLRREGIDPGRTTILKHSWKIEDVIDGRVDAVSAYAMVEPAHMRARGVEPSVLRALDYGVDFYGDTLFTTDEEIRTNPIRARAVIRASIKGWEYALDHPDEMAELILKMEGVHARGVTRQMLLDEAQALRAYILPDIIELGHMNPGRWDQIAHAFLASEHEPLPRSLDGFIYDPGRVDASKYAAGLTVVTLLILAAIIAVVINVRGRRRALRDVQTLLEEMLDNSPSLIFIKDTEGRYLLINRQFEKRFGVKRTDVLGRCDDEIFEPRQAELFQANDRQVMLEGAKNFEETAMYQDGRHISIVSKFPVLDSSGSVRGVGGIATDITEYRNAQEKIQEQASLLEKARDAIIVRTLDHRITYWNQSAERLYGWTAGEAIGRSVVDLLYKDPTDFYRAHEHVKKSGEWVGELQQVSRSGQDLIIEGRWTLVRDAEGRDRSVLAINTDITERRNLERQFLRAQRLESIGTLAGGIAHDLNNVLSPILMAAELLQMNPMKERDAELVHKIIRSARRGADMVNQVLAFARGAEGRRTVLNLGEIILEVEKIVRDTFPKQIEIEVQLDPDLRPVHGDHTQIHQVILNLCVNARDAIAGSGRIRISARNVVFSDAAAAAIVEGKPGNYIRIDVSDTGAGIPPSIIDKIFDPFFTTKGTGSGTGLGLSTSLTIVKSHGGTLRAVSADGETHMTVYLPVTAESTTDQEREPPPERPVGHGETVLLVEDEVVLREVIVRTLEAFGYKVIAAANGREAVKLFSENKDVIQAAIVDMMMPVLDGPKTIRELVEIQPRLRIIAASGIPANGELAFAAGASGFIAKPYSTETILGTLHAVLHS